jgi:transcriptional regulator with XRE-family HTH domain
MLSLNTEADVVRGTRESLRAHRLALSWRQDDLAQKSGVGIATLRRFERTGRIGLPALAKLLVTLGLADKFLEALKPLPPRPSSISEFLAEGQKPARRRAPNAPKGA